MPRHKAWTIEGAAPAFSVTVLLEVAGSTTRLFQFVGDPCEEVLHSLLDYVGQLSAAGGRINVVLGGRGDQAEQRRWAAILRASQESASVELGAAVH
ncbi:MAG: hypothetical protein HY699_25490 [Deltaproteobacteria bacterium]|nr:hypothetical protein [Deltaproteobacteria bacterium]